jgi:phosphoribosylglycinamide formyltransferase 2
MVTLASQNLSEFDLHLRAVMGLPIPDISYFGPTASAVILADRESSRFEYRGLEKALKVKNSEVRIFGKPTTRKYRRMGVALSRSNNVEQARKQARLAASKIEISYLD